MGEFYWNDDEDNEDNNDYIYKIYGIVGLLLGIIGIILYSTPVVGVALGVLGIIFSALGKYSINKIITVMGSLLSIMAVIIGIYLIIDDSIHSIDSNKKMILVDNANMVEEYINREYSLGISNDSIINICGNNGKDCINKEILFRVSGANEILRNSGLYSYDFDLNNSYFRVSKNYDICVVLYSSYMGKYSDIKKPGRSNGCK